MTTNKGQDVEQDAFDESVDELADSYLEEEKGQFDSSLESFELHAAKVRAEFHKNMDTFRKRFLKGYELLLEELFQQYTGGVRETKEVPPDAIKL